MDAIAWVRVSSCTLPLATPISDAKVLTGRQKPMTEVALLFAEVIAATGLGFLFFLTVSGIAFEFGLSHTNISEVTIKQAMIRAAREVILVADHSSFGQESMVQVAPLNVVHKVITDDALPASVRTS